MYVATPSFMRLTRSLKPQINMGHSEPGVQFHSFRAAGGTFGGDLQASNKPFPTPLPSCCVPSPACLVCPSRMLLCT
jgi:hypothetical protein